MSINSRYTHAAGGREMAATSSQSHGPAGEGEGEGDCSSYYSSSEEELGMAGPEEDTRRLLRPDDDGPRYGAPLVVASPAALYPQLVGHGDHQGLTHPAAGPVMAAGNAGGEMHNTQYGSVSSSLPSNGRNKTKWKRYRLPFLILLVFDCGLVIFLSIISYDSKKSGLDDPIPQLAYFRFDLQKNFFDLVLLGMLRLLLNSLLYIMMGWVTRTVMAVTTVVSAVYVPLKAYYCWPLTSSANDGGFQDIPILLILFVSFVMPWAEAFFFEFKYLPAELGRLTTVSWRRWEFWLWPRALVRPDLTDPPSLPDMAAQPQPNVLTAPPAMSRHYAISTVSLDFRTPMGSTRNSPIPNHLVYGERSCNTAPDEDLPPISEETTPPPGQRENPLIRRTLSVEDQRYKAQGERVLQQMIEFTASNDTWKFERTSNEVTFYSTTWQGKKVWKAEREMDARADQLWNILYPGNQMPQWNPQCTMNESVYKVDEETDVVYSVSCAVGPVSSRDFVSLRHISTTEDGSFISASVATTFDQKPNQPGKVRGENGPCGYKVVPIASNKCLFIWVLNTDLKGWLPQSVIDQTLCGAMSNTFQKLTQFIEQRRSDGGL